MLDFITSPAVGLMVLGVLVLEGVALLVLWRTRGQGLRPAEVVTFLGAGAAFAVCLTAALGDWGALWIAGPLVVAFVCHVADLKGRWQS